MAADIRAMLAKKNEEKNSGKRLVMKDINRDLITALLAIPIYGKEARDEEILSIIINGGVSKSIIDKIKDSYNTRLENKEIKKSKSGDVVDKDGFMVLVPRI